MVVDIMKKEYEKPCFVPVVLEANVLATCVPEDIDDSSGMYTNGWGYYGCPIDIGIGSIFVNDDCDIEFAGCPAGGTMPNPYTFGS